MVFYVVMPVFYPKDADSAAIHYEMCPFVDVCDVVERGLRWGKETKYEYQYDANSSKGVIASFARFFCRWCVSHRARRYFVS